MASFDGLSLLTAAMLAVLRATFATATYPTTATASSTVTVYDGVAGQPPRYPCVIVGDHGTAQPFNTLGAATDAKFGSVPRSVVRLITQYPTTRAQAGVIWAAVKAAVDGQELAVVGFGDVLVTCEFETDLTAALNGPTQFERVGEFEAELHQ